MFDPFDEGAATEQGAHDLSVDALVMSAVWRSAGLEIVRGARIGWTRRDLARWLLGPYGEATLHLPRAGEPRAGDAARVDERRLDRVLATMRSEVIEWLEAARRGGGPEFVRQAIRDRAIVSTVDGLWMPVDKPRMLLKDRVLALFAADFLLWPQGYVGDLVICSKCDEVTFDPAARQTGCCGAHRISGFVELLRGPDGATLPRAS